MSNDNEEIVAPTLFSKLMRFWLQQKLLVFIGILGILLVGLAVAPFDWDIPLLPRHPVPVDAIPDIGENQQIVFTTWEGRSAKDVEDQITYPLTIQLLGIPGVKAIRSYSYSDIQPFTWYSKTKLNSTGPGLGYWSDSIHWRRARYPRVCSRLWVRTPPLSDKSIGTPLKADSSAWMN